MDLGYEKGLKKIIELGLLSYFALRDYSNKRKHHLSFKCKIKKQKVLRYFQFKK